MHAVPPSDRNARILVVGPPDEVREVAVVLAHLGYETRVSERSDAVNAGREFEPDLVIADHEAVVEDPELIPALQALDRTHLPVVALVPSGADMLLDSIEEAGADEFISLPIDPAKLRVRTRAMLRLRDAHNELVEHCEVLERLATTDELTGVGNRRAFDQRIAEELERSGRYGRPMSLIMADLDHFKRVNDDFGHAMGDQVLRQLGVLLASHVRRPDAAFRVGGEEFAIITPETDSRQAYHLAERIRLAFESESSALPCGRLTVSLGVAGTNRMHWPVTPEAIYAAADAALYRAKQDGRNRVDVA